MCSISGTLFSAIWSGQCSSVSYFRELVGRSICWYQTNCLCVELSGIIFWQTMMIHQGYIDTPTTLCTEGQINFRSWYQLRYYLLHCLIIQSLLKPSASILLTRQNRNLDLNTTTTVTTIQPSILPTLNQQRFEMRTSPMSDDMDEGKGPITSNSN